MMKMKQEADGNVEVSEGKLVWYNERKGYGFVRIGDEEVFLHRSKLDRFGFARLLTGDVVTVSLSTNEHCRVIKVCCRSNGRSRRHRRPPSSPKMARCAPS